ANGRSTLACHGRPGIEVVSAQGVSSPDGRVWTVTMGRSKSSLEATRKEPFFWTHVIVTTAVLVAIIFILRLPWTGILTILLPIALVLWLIGAVSSSFRAQIYAETPGPPPEHRMWTVTKRFHAKQSLQEVTEAIRAGDLTREPDGTRLAEI